MPPKKKRRRRAKGEGGLHQRADGIWIAQVWRDDGSRYQRGRKRYDDALEELQKMRDEIRDGIDPSKGTITVADWLTYWLDDIAADRVRPRTLASYRSTVRNQITPRLGDKKLGRLTPADVRSMIKTVTAERSSRTAQIAFNVLAPALADAVKDGRIRYNPCDRMDRPEARSEKRAPLTVEQAKAVLMHAATTDARDAARWALSLMSGVRQAEALGLTWDRIDFNADIIDVTVQLQRLKLKPGFGRPADPNYPREVFDVRKVDYEFAPIWRTACLVNTKTDGSRRLVPMIAPLRAALLALRDAGQGNVGGLVFARGDGTPMLPRDDTAAWRRLCVDAGIVAKGAAPPDQHVGRHTTATLLLEAGVPESTRMAILGHTTVTAHREYAHVDVGPQRAALGKLGELLAPPDPS